jgi:hypothetical protein
MPIPGFEEAMDRLRALREVADHSNTWKEAVLNRGLLPVYSDWECGYALDADGQPLYSSEVSWKKPEPLTNPRHRHIVWAQAAKRYAELAHLRPQRQQEDPSCPSCSGTGVVTVGDQTYPEFICECGGLGWFPVGSALGPI